MTEKLQAFKAEIKNKKIAVIGPAASNISLVEYLGKLDAQITVFDRCDRENLKEKIESFNSFAVDYCLGQDCLGKLKGFDIIFRPPIVRPDIPELLREAQKGAIITSEAEVFIDLCPATVYGITGSDGKTTTATIVHELLKAQGYRCFLGGNIGTPLLNRIDEIGEGDMVVLELSSLQLLAMKHSPQTAVITNISPNHPDIHSSMDEYIEAKKNIFRCQKPNDVIVVNYDNAITHDFRKEAPGRTLYFSRRSELENGAFLKGESLCFGENGTTHEIVNRKDIRLPGEHNIENYLAAIAATYPAVMPETVGKVAGSLAGIEHSMEFVRELNGVRYYNDSKGSSPSRTMAALKAFDRRLILIAGGYGKNISYDSLGDVLVEKAKHLILIGQTASLIEMALLRRLTGKNRGLDIRITRCATLKQAVDCAYFSAKTGDVVLLSPASAGSDMFGDSEERGVAFKKYVHDL